MFGGGDVSFHEKMAVGIVADECSAARKQVVDGVNHFSFFAVKKEDEIFFLRTDLFDVGFAQKSYQCEM